MHPSAQLSLYCLDKTFVKENVCFAAKAECERRVFSRETAPSVTASPVAIVWRLCRCGSVDLEELICGQATAKPSEIETKLYDSVLSDAVKVLCKSSLACKHGAVK